MQPIKTLDEAVELLNHPEELEKYLRARLVLLSGETGASAVRAIELLRNLPPAKVDDDLKDIPTEVLMEAGRRARAYIQRIRANGNAGLEEDGA